MFDDTKVSTFKPMQTFRNNFTFKKNLYWNSKSVVWLVVTSNEFD